VSAARRAAFEVLKQVESTSAHSDDLLHGAALTQLSQVDKNLATALVLGVLRWQIALDADLKAVLERPEQPLPLEILLALRMGAFQLLHMDRIPAHAALSESVELVKEAGHPKAAGLVNAVLRKMAAKREAKKPIFESVAAVASRLGHPEWLVDRWVSTYGRGAAVAVCEHDQREPADGALFEPLSEGGGISLDDGSRLVAELTAASVERPARIWDACAAPGGKTMVLAQRLPQAEVLATDVSSRRLESMRRRFEREIPGRRVEALAADATRLPESEGGFDLILCDVPCSGTGTLGRNPEIRHRLQAADLERQAQRQREILLAAAARVKPGGRLVYSTCSLEPEENEAVVQSVLADASGLRVVPVGGLLDRLRSTGVVRATTDETRWWVRGEFLRTIPGANFEGDGFFAAVLARD
jgi:16S rRNA (cytosine967-C5)-methyltransferase